MIDSNRYLFLSAVFLLFVGFINAQETPLRYDFSGKTAEENKMLLQGAGFGAYPMAAVLFGEIPIDNTFDGATDGKGVIITAKPGEGAMMFGQKVTTNYSAMVRCSVRTDKPTASVILAVIGDKPDIFVSQNTPNNEGYFTGQYLRLQTFCVPPSTGFQPVIQIINTSKTETMTAYLDNLEITLIDPNKYYSGAYLDGDETDPPAGKISIPAGGGTGLNPDNSLTINLPLPSGAKPLGMVLIPTGTFKMGSLESDIYHSDSELPQHNVTITKPFYLGEYEITQAQWVSVMGGNPSYSKGDNLPVENVSWNDCQTFIGKINALGQGTFRLPTEAEWEYACRSTSESRFYWGDDEEPSMNMIDEYEWYTGNAKNKTHEVGTLMQNWWGLFDMSGNVSEWCFDSYVDYSSAEQQDPVGTGSGAIHVLRGGNYLFSKWTCRSAFRFKFPPIYRSSPIGFRLVRNY